MKLINPSILPILLVNFIGTMGYSIVLPFLVILVIEFGGNELIYGFLGATYSGFQFIGAPILGRWSDDIGRRKVLLISQGGTLLAWLIFLTALSIPMISLVEVDHGFAGTFTLTIPLLLLFVARSLDGLTGGNIAVANAYLADVSTEKDRKKNFGQMAASASTGFIIGPAAAGVLGATALGYFLPVGAAIGISVLALIFIFTLLEDAPVIASTPVQESSRQKLLGCETKECKVDSDKSFRHILGLEGIPFLLALYFLIFLGFNLYYVAFPFHAYETLGWEVLDLGMYFTVMSLGLIIVQGPLLGYLSDLVSDSRLFVVGTVFLVGCFFLLMSTEKWVLFLAAGFFSLGNGLMWPSFLSILSKAGDKESQGAIQGYASSAGSLASIIGMVSGGLLYGTLGSGTFFIPCVIFAITGFAAVRLSRYEKQISPTS